MPSPKISEAAKALNDLFHELVTRKVDLSVDYDPDQPDDEAPLSEANVVTSRRKTDGKHALVLDLDHPSWLLASSTPGHYHLIVDVPGGITAKKYFRLLRALADAGVIEEPFARLSARRGASYIRLPWVKKKITDHAFRTWAYSGTPENCYHKKPNGARCDRPAALHDRVAAGAANPTGTLTGRLSGQRLVPSWVLPPDVGERVPAAVSAFATFFDDPDEDEGAS